MKCTIHGIEMEYAGENPFGGDIWYCEACHVAEEAEFSHVSDEYPDDDGMTCPKCGSSAVEWMGGDNIVDISNDLIRVDYYQCYDCNEKFSE